MDYWKFSIQVDTTLKEALLGLLSTLPFDSYEEDTAGWQAYLAAQEEVGEVEQSLLAFQAVIPFTYQKEWVEAQNWNAIWEANFEPIRVRDFCGIRAAFHPPFEGVQYELIIQPKMAFGTGHHATTYMMVAEMEGIEFSQQQVLDYGAGTGILAILAKQCSAKTVDAVEIDPQACENAVENCAMNNTPEVQVLAGDLQVVVDKTYDVVLANINRNVILASLSTLFSMIHVGGKLLVSGILEADGPQVIGAAAAQGFLHQTSQQKEGWLCIAFTR
ncbi:MAG: 50S ribosomal protein L11 methyltransferase [Bacteroidota bacterium]